MLRGDWIQAILRMARDPGGAPGANWLINGTATTGQVGLLQASGNQSWDAQVYLALPLMTCRTIGLTRAQLNMIFTRSGKSLRLMVPLPAPPQALPSW